MADQPTTQDQSSTDAPASKGVDLDARLDALLAELEQQEPGLVAKARDAQATASPIPAPAPEPETDPAPDTDVDQSATSADTAADRPTDPIAAEPSPDDIADIRHGQAPDDASEPNIQHGVAPQDDPGPDEDRVQHGMAEDSQETFTPHPATPTDDSPIEPDAPRTGLAPDPPDESPADWAAELDTLIANTEPATERRLAAAAPPDPGSLSAPSPPSRAVDNLTMDIDALMAEAGVAGDSKQTPGRAPQPTPPSPDPPAAPTPQAATTDNLTMDLDALLAESEAPPAPDHADQSTDTTAAAPPVASASRINNDDLDIDALLAETSADGPTAAEPTAVPPKPAASMSDRIDNDQLDLDALLAESAADPTLPSEPSATTEADSQPSPPDDLNAQIEELFAEADSLDQSSAAPSTDQPAPKPADQPGQKISLDEIDQLLASEADGSVGEDIDALGGSFGDDSPIPAAEPDSAAVLLDDNTSLSASELAKRKAAAQTVGFNTTAQDVASELDEEPSATPSSSDSAPQAGAEPAKKADGSQAASPATSGRFTPISIWVRRSLYSVNRPIAERSIQTRDAIGYIALLNALAGTVMLLVSALGIA